MKTGAGYSQPCSVISCRTAQCMLYTSGAQPSSGTRYALLPICFLQESHIHTTALCKCGWPVLMIILMHGNLCELQLFFQECDQELLAEDA